MVSEVNMLSTAELWKKLSDLANFEDSAYDKELKNSIAKKLNLDEKRFEEELGEKGISADRLLTAVLDALKPFSQMMGELLKTYEAAGAVSNNKNIQIRFNFDDGPEQYDLNAFRKKVEIIGDGVETRRKLIDPWKFLEPLYMYENKGTFPAHRMKGYNYPKEIEQWLRDYENDILPEHFPDFLLIGNGFLDEKLGEILALAEEALQRYRREYDETIGWKQSFQNAKEKYDNTFWHAESDHWLSEFVKVFYDVTTYSKEVISPYGMIGRIEKVLNDPKTVSRVTEKTLYRVLTDILDMPFWKHRYEMYSAWVFTCIAESVSDLGICYNVENGVLEFKFRETLLATVFLPDGDYEIWAEKRYKADHVTPGSGRKEHIQPDYSIIRRNKDSESFCALIECKQYKKSSTRNFAAAVNDYAGNVPDAKVFLVNYGPISKNLYVNLNKDVRSRYSGYSRMRPETNERNQFIGDLRDYLEGQWADIQFENNRELTVWEKRPEEIKVELLWKCSPKDLDLWTHIRMPFEGKDYSLNCRHMGSVTEFPYACLEKDMRNGPANETILIKKLISGSYDVSVRNYSREEDIDGEIRVKISSGDQFFEITKTGRWEKNHIWHVGTVNAFGFIKKNGWGY
jgi:hypothetical protein